MCTNFSFQEGWQKYTCKAGTHKSHDALHHRKARGPSCCHHQPLGSKAPTGEPGPRSNYPKPWLKSIQFKISQKAMSSGLGFKKKCYKNKTNMLVRTNRGSRRWKPQENAIRVSRKTGRQLVGSLVQFPKPWHRTGRYLQHVQESFIFQVNCVHLGEWRWNQRVRKKREN